MADAKAKTINVFHSGSVFDDGFGKRQRIGYRLGGTRPR